MGYVHSGLVKRAGDHLIDILLHEITVRYSRFYDGTDETSEALQKALEMDEMDGPEGRMDDAVYQLEKQGFVTTKELPDKLADGEQDYEIQITEKALDVMSRGGEPRYWDMDQ